ncbi:MAG TPA: hypothetical protein VIG44_10770, partial [Thermomicrobiales bacterium]
IPLKLPIRAPKPSSSSHAPPSPADPESGSAPGGYLRLSNGAATLLVALGAPDATLPGFARLIGPTLFVAPNAPALPVLAGYVRPWALVSLFSGPEPDATILPARTLIVPQGQGFTMLLDPHGVRIQDIPNAPAWAMHA